MGLIDPQLNNMLNALIGKAFNINRLLDRQVSLLSIKYTMLNLSREYHSRVAHFFPHFADRLSEYQDARNMATIYPETMIGNQDYASILEMFQKFYDELIEYERMILQTISFALQKGDVMTRTFLDGLLLDLSKFTGLAINLIDIFTNIESASHLMIIDSVSDRYFVEFESF